ncbi:unnamed protein product [Porites lobata]|uniref:RNA-binding protein 48 n=1 Tax=Porites lobata TaxID=104759 RepID=A0ABN8QHF6_9CNID|nr:unnamed protein product [Porites lobata]
MADGQSKHSDAKEVSSVKKHHKQTSLSYSRPKYREARWERAVKVYTINLESKYVLVQGVPAVGAVKELLEQFALYGAIEEYRFLDEYPAEPFTEVYWIKFQRINSARFAKKKLDNKSFFGGILHVCYAPEFETVNDTREKLQERRKVIAKKTRELFGEQQKKTVTKDSSPVGTEDSLPKKPTETSQRIPESSSDDQRLQTSLTVKTSGLSYHANYTDHMLQSSSSFPTLPPPPQHLYPFQYPPRPPPWDLPRVPSAHATLPAYMQNFPPPPPLPPPPPPPPTAEPSVLDNVKTSRKSEQERPFTVYMSQVMIGPQLEEGDSSNQASLTGDDSLDKTAISIRNKIHKLSRVQEELASTTPNIQIVQNPGELATSSVPAKKKRKRI